MTADYTSAFWRQDSHELYALELLNFQFLYADWLRDVREMTPKKWWRR